jgi:two-component system response regulator FixJ
MPSNPVIHIIDDDEAVRESLAFLLQSADYEVQSYDSATKFLAEVSRHSPGCVITDVRMPDVSGIDLLRQLRERGSEFPVIVITGHGDIPLAVEAMKLGAADFFEKPYDDYALLKSVRAALDRKGNLDKQNAARVEFSERLATLSNRERQVLDGLVAGKPNKVIAFDHGISPRTVEIYRANVMTKMQASSLSELVRMAMIAGVLGNKASPGAS